MDKQAQSSIQAKQIELIESNFKKGDFSEKHEFKFDIEISSKEESSNFISIIKLTLRSSKYPDFSIDVAMKGIFEVEGDLPFSLEQFGQINAPSMIYPYIRQHIRHLTLEANISPPILFPVINFATYYKIRNEQKKQS